MTQTYESSDQRNDNPTILLSMRTTGAKIWGLIGEGSDSLPSTDVLRVIFTGYSGTYYGTGRYGYIPPSAWIRRIGASRVEAPTMYILLRRRWQMDSWSPGLTGGWESSVANRIDWVRRVRANGYWCGRGYRPYLELWRRGREST